MAAPHVVGLAAYFQALGANSDAITLCRNIQSFAIPNAIGNEPRNTVNLLAFNGAGRR